MNKLKIIMFCLIVSILNFTNTKAIDYNVYCNTRYNYTVSYPKNWTSIKESDNGDGAVLYNDGENDIRVYANYAINNEAPEIKERFITDNKENGLITVHCIYTKSNIEYNLYIKTTQAFYDKEKDSILHIKKSLELYFKE